MLRGRTPSAKNRCGPKAQLGPTPLLAPRGAERSCLHNALRICAFLYGRPRRHPMSGPKRAQRHEPMMSATCRAEQHQDQPDDVTHVCRWLSHAGLTHNCNCGHSWEDSFEDRVMAGFAPALMQTLQGHTEASECTCGNTYETHQGPEPDCPLHGAVRAFNEAQAENERLKAAVERVRADVIDQRNKAGITKDPWKRGAYAQAVRTLQIINAALDAPRVPGSPGSKSCPLCGGAGAVPGTEEPETNTAGEPCDCMLRGES